MDQVSSLQMVIVLICCGKLVVMSNGSFIEILSELIYARLVEIR
jgi:hypothetical protein